MGPIQIIYNPSSGAGLGQRNYDIITAILKEKNIPYTSTQSEHIGHPTEIAAHAVAAGVKQILCLGGDGSVRETGISLAGTETVLSIIPSGSGNDLARALKIPTDPVKALDIALNCTPRKMDVGDANGKLFFNVAGFGFDVDVLEWDQVFRSKGFKGSFSYLLGLLKSLSNLLLRKTRITTPEMTTERNCLIVAVGNGTSFGGGMTVCPGADPFDGKFNVCVMHDVNRANCLVLLAKFLSGKHVNDKKHVDYFQTTEITCECEPSSMLELDGEIMKGTPVTFRLIPGGITVTAPEN